MKKIVAFICALVIAAFGFFGGWLYFMQTVEAGYVGVLVNLYADRGVQNEVVGTGRHFVSWNERLYAFPTFNQLYNYEEPFVFQTSDAMDVKAHVGVEYNVVPEKANVVFQKYRKGIEEITQVNIRQQISDALIRNASTMTIETLSAGGKNILMDKVLQNIRSTMEPIGIHIVRLSWTGELEYPKSVRDSINAKIDATQRALRIENEIASAKNEASKKIETAKGEAESIRLKAEAEAQAIAIRAAAEANAIKARGEAIRNNPEVVNLEAIKQWNGKLPQIILGEKTMPILQLESLTKTDQQK